MIVEKSECENEKEVKIYRGFVYIVTICNVTFSVASVDCAFNMAATCKIRI